jgi:hypothetical protein
VHLANDGIAKPFGAIDTPGQGETVSGVIANFGWALTPDSDYSTGFGDILIPPDGSRITVFIDGQPPARVQYNQCRGTVGNPVPADRYCDDDVASIFGNSTPQPPFSSRTINPTRYRNLDEGRGAIGWSYVDTTKLTNGMHSIAWSVTDSAWRVEGIGSRFFTVLNTASDAVTNDVSAFDMRPSSTGVPPLTEQTTSARSRPLTSAEARVARARAARRTKEEAVDNRSSEQLSPSPDSSPMVRSRIGFDLQASSETLLADADGVRRVRLPELGRLELWLGRADRGYQVANGTRRDLPVGSHLDAETGEFTWTPPSGYLGTYRLAFMRASEEVIVDVTVGPAK